MVVLLFFAQIRVFFIIFCKKNKKILVYSKYFLYFCGLNVCARARVAPAREKNK